MQQTVYDLIDGSVLSIGFPHARATLLRQVKWGDVGALFTPAFWKAQLWYARNRNDDAYLDYTTGRTLREEVVACLLGGHGISAEMAQAAFHHLRDRDLMRADMLPTAGMIERALKVPMAVPGRPHPVRYRFPCVKAQFIASAMRRLDAEPPLGDIALRDWLCSFSGIGWKTASWITRNWNHSNTVAVIDIHVFRAGVIAGLFEGSESSISSRYKALEGAFLEFAAALNEEPRRLDVIIWRTMKDSAALGLKVYKTSRTQLLQAA